MHLQMTHQTLYIPKDWRPLPLPLTPTSRATRIDTRCCSLACPATTSTLSAAEETTISTNFAVACRSAAADVVNVGLQSDMGFGKEDL